MIVFVETVTLRQEHVTLHNDDIIQAIEFGCHIQSKANETGRLISTSLRCC